MANELEEVDAWPPEQLLAAVLARGRAGEPRAREVALDLLAGFGGPAGLARASCGELTTHLGGAADGTARAADAAKARCLAAAFELGRRAARDSVTPTLVTNSADVAAWAMPRLGGLDHEELWLLALDGRSRLRGTRCVARGGLHGMGARPADALRLALRAAASGFVLVHNHPSGDPSPSNEDIAFTLRLAAAGAVVGLPLLDHVVVTRDSFASVPFSTSEETSPPSPPTLVEA